MKNQTESKKKHDILEKKVLTKADLVTTVSPSWKDLFQEKGAGNVEVFTNGYEKALFKRQPDQQERLQEQIDDENELFFLRHVGSMDESRNPQNLWDSLTDLHNMDDSGLQVELIGDISTPVLNKISSIQFVKSIPAVSHAAAIKLMQTSDALLLCNNRSGANKGRIPAKFFEYVGAQRPILYFGEVDNDCARLISQNKLGIVLPYNADKTEISQGIQAIKTFKLPTQMLHQYTREEISKKFDKQLNQLLQ